MDRWDRKYAGQPLCMTIRRFTRQHAIGSHRTRSLASNGHFQVNWFVLLTLALSSLLTVRKQRVFH